MKTSQKSIYISAAHKSSGKTIISIGLARVISNLNYNIQVFKKGPDYIDMNWLSLASRSNCYNLDFNTQTNNEIKGFYESKKLNFNFHHLASSNLTFIDKEFEEKKKIFYDFNSYEAFFQKEGIIINQDKRRKIIEKEFEKVSNKKNLKIKENHKLLEEVVNLTDKPHVLECSFDKRFLFVPKEILILTMQMHQKYFPLFTRKNEITNEFLVVANNKDKKGLIKIGNERVIEARLSDAEFFCSL